jgi:hypothetical protein
MLSPSLRRPVLALTFSVAVAGLSTLLFQREPLVSLVFALGLFVLGLGLRHPDLAIFAVLFLLYSNLPAVGVTFHGVPKPLAVVFPLLLAVPLVRDLFSRREPLIVTPVLLVLVLFLGVQAIGAALSIDAGRLGGHLRAGGRRPLPAGTKALAQEIQRSLSAPR